MNHDPFRPAPCIATACRNPSLPLSNPPRCNLHVEDPVAWYEEAADAGRAPVPFLHERFKYALVATGVPALIHDEYETRRKAGHSIKFSFEDAIFFICHAAAAGVLGNLSYAGLTRLVRRIMGPKGNSDEAADHLAGVISEDRYKRLADEHSEEVVIEEETQLEMKLRRTYRLVVRTQPMDKEDA